MNAIMLREWLLANGPVKTRVHGAQRRLFTPRADDMLCIESRRGSDGDNRIFARRSQYDSAVNAIIAHTRRQQAKIDALRLEKKLRRRKRQPIQLSLLGEE